MIIHISKARYEHIRGQGYNMTHYIAESGPISLTGRRYSDGDNVYHLLDGEHARCETCGSEFDSIVADTPAELEVAKGKAA